MNEATNDGSIDEVRKDDSHTHSHTHTLQDLTGTSSNSTDWLALLAFRLHLLLPRFCFRSLHVGYMYFPFLCRHRYFTYHQTKFDNTVNCPELNTEKSEGLPKTKQSI